MSSLDQPPRPASALTPRAQAEADQALASDPARSAWVEASAGSGKTKVLTDRVLRLLLAGGKPSRILCLTFTKAAAAEMATRLARELGRWAVATPAELTESLRRITGQVPDAALLGRARQLFAEVLELPGGMRISTIHAFCQSLLRSFPLEASLPPQFGVIEGADAETLLAEAREIVLAGGEYAEGLTALAGLVPPDDFSQAVGALALERQKLVACLQAAGSGGLPALEQILARAIGLAPGETEAVLVERICAVPELVHQAAAALLNHKNKTQKTLAAELRTWLALDAASRTARHAEYLKLLFTDKGEPRKSLDAHPDLLDEAARILALQEKVAACKLHSATAALLGLAHPVLLHYEARKRRVGRLDYQDLIDRARRVLEDPGSAWVLFKLDEGLDHILLDEAQDTNAAQWGIASALSGEFFVGEGARPEAPGAGRSVFAVGDIKQAIYGFQGADPVGFGTWRRHFQGVVGAAGGAFSPVQLNVSFRSTAPVLALVDAVFADGIAREGVVPEGRALQHRPDRIGQAGTVELWPPLVAGKAASPEPWVVPEEAEGAAGPDALLAEALAARVRHMLDHDVLPARCDHPGGPPRRVRPSDVLVLVRRRTGFVQLLVRALKERDVPVGGVDRLVLIEQIAVQDLLALCDVLLLPEDDLQLAAALKSPLLGLDEDDVFALAHGRRGSLWAALAEHRGASTPMGLAADRVAALMARADLVTPHGLLAEILGEPLLPSGPGGRARLLARLGPDAADPLDEVLNAALRYEASHPPSLQGFLHWLRRGGAEVKREAEAAADAVRIMTVHGAKGLQAPIVIIPDVGSGRGDRAIRWAEHEGVELPFWAPRNRKEFHAPAFKRIIEADSVKRREEENRLLYVALTRAEDRLLVCAREEADPDSWYGLVAAGFRRLENCEDHPFDAALFGAPSACGFGGVALRRHGCEQTAAPVPDRRHAVREAVALPDWVHRPAPAELATGPLSPSNMPVGATPVVPVPGETEPPAAAPHGLADPTGRRFRRGRLVHALLQHLPEREPMTRAEAARRFLARPGHGLEAAEQAEIAAEVLALLDAPGMVAAFAPGSLAEAPIAGRIKGLPVAGQVDRLAVLPDRVLVVDYKTNRPPPERPEDVAPMYLRQMAAYRALLQQAYPGRRVECALLWTYGARLMVLPDAVLDTMG